MNRRCGRSITQTPPRPTATLVTRVPPSQNTVRSSCRPSPSRSARTTIRSRSESSQTPRPLPAQVKFSATQSRPQASVQMPIGFCTSGSAANDWSVKPSGRRAVRQTSAGSIGRSADFSELVGAGKSAVIAVRTTRNATRRPVATPTEGRNQLDPRMLPLLVWWRRVCLSRPPASIRWLWRLAAVRSSAAAHGGRVRRVPPLVCCTPRFSLWKRCR